MVINSEIVEQLATLKDKKGITLPYLAELTNLDEKELSRILSGIDSPNLDILQRIAAALDMKIILVDQEYNLE